MSNLVPTCRQSGFNYICWSAAYVERIDALEGVITDIRNTLHAARLRAEESGTRITTLEAELAEAKADYLRIHTLYCDAKHPESTVINVKALEERINELEETYEPWRKCEHLWIDYPTLTGPDHGRSCSYCGIQYDAWKRLEAGEAPWWYVKKEDAR